MQADPEAVRHPDLKQRLIEHVAELAVAIIPTKGQCSPSEAVDLVWKCYIAARNKVDNEWPQLKSSLDKPAG
jgi:hypothetical protein